MLKYILETTEKYRLEDLRDVDAFKQWLYQDAAAQGYDINSFGYTEKAEKEGKELVGYYYVVTVKKKFNPEKECMTPSFGPIEYYPEIESKEEQGDA